MSKRFYIFFLFLVATLFLRDVPYVNVFIINKIWIIYILLFMVFILPPISQKHLLMMLFMLLPLALIFTLFKLIIASEIIGVLIYVMLIGVVVYRFFSLLKERL